MPLNIDIQQILLHMLNFVILFGALYFLLYKPVSNFMKNRNEKLINDRKEAESALEEAEALKAEYEEKLADFKAEESELKAQALGKAKEDADVLLNDAKKQAADIIAQSKLRAEREKEKIIKSANSEIRSIAEEAAQKLVIDGEDAYDSFLKSFNSNSDREKK